jgi:hypothetical protein
MNAKTLQRLLLAAVSSASLYLCACSSTGDCRGLVTTTYAMAILDDAGVGDDGGPADAGPRPTTCEEACKRLNEWSTVVSCSFTKIEEKGRMVDAVECKANPMCEGRRPSELRSHAEGSDFAAAAHLEAASVYAFAHLARELRHHGAPQRLIRAARRSRRDEIRHARATSALARKRGLQITRPEVAPMTIRELEAIAIENAVEGCVRETYGAMTAWWRALHSPDRDVRAAYVRIARDETRHASLARELDRWLLARLDPRARARVEAARNGAYEELRAELSRGRGDGAPVELVLSTLGALM